jgi:GT2 family glycosyltransferase
MVFRRELFDEIGLYDETFRYSQDYDLMLRAVSRLKISNLPEFLLNYRISEGAISSKQMKRQELCALLARVKALHRYGYPQWQGIYLLKPALSFLVPAALKRTLIKKFSPVGRI